MIRAVKRIAPIVLPMIAVDRRAARALHKQIYDSFRSAIVNGSLRPAQRVPSTRVLALELGVSRFPILNAYAQLLAEGFFESRVGAGTIVAGSLPQRATSSPPKMTTRTVAGSGPRAVSRGAMSLPSFERPARLGWGAFGVGQVALDQFPMHDWSRVVSRRNRKMDIASFRYGDPLGLGSLRQAVASYLRTARSLRCEADQIMIVSGSQHALELSARVLLDPGDSVWIEEPGYRFAQHIFRLNGSVLVPIPVDKEGLDVAAGIKACRKARVAFVTPSHQFPLGVTMSASRRLQLLDWARSNGSWIIEDDYDSEYRYESFPVAPLQGVDSSDRVIYIGTFSKVLFPSLRIGYVVIPPDLINSFLAVRRAMDLCPPSFSQEVLADFIGEGHFARHIRRMKVLYQERRDALVASIDREIGSMVEVLGSEAGMQLTVALPKGARDVEIAKKAALQNVWMWPLSPSYVGERSRPGLILGFGSAVVSEIPRAVRKLRSVLEAK